MKKTHLHIILLFALLSLPLLQIFHITFHYPTLFSLYLSTPLLASFTHPNNLDPTLPKIYIHQLPPFFNSDLLKGRITIPDTGIIGQGPHLPSDPPHIFQTHQYATELMIHKRLASSRYRTYDPAEADYIYLPYYRGMDKKNTLNKRWKALFNNPRQLLEVPGIEFASVPFLVYSVTYHSFWRADQFYKENVLTIEQAVPFPPDLKQRNSTDECLHFQIPHPSYVHVPARNYPLQQLPWTVTDPAKALSRKYLAAFIGSIVTKSTEPLVFPTKFFEARWHLEKIMSAEENMLFQQTSSTSKARSGSQYTFALDYYKTSTFCPHIGGDFCHRKAFYDSLLHGCIPVVFDTLNCEWAFKDLIDYRTITLEVSFEEAVERKRLPQLLGQVSDAEILSYRHNISEVAHQLQMSLYDDEHDMLGTALREAKKMLPFFKL